MSDMTQTRTEFPFEVDVLEHLPIKLANGQTISARVWMPLTDVPAPAVLEHLPYRKDDMTYWRDEVQMQYLAGHGYVCVRTDLRGTGDSEGVLKGEYLDQELADGAEVIAWIADQQWCDGNVGMWGISWGGFNSLQVAALRPPALKAIISVASTVDRYAADAHYNGGCVIGSEMLPWATSMLYRNGLPPTPRFVGSQWRSLWLDRLDETPPFIEDWLTHQTRDEFWRHGSISEDYSAIEVPCLVVAGFADGYRNAPFDAVEGMPDRAWGLVGPWAHNYPEFGEPGPNIGFLQHSLRWWDRWLRGLDNGIDKEPHLRVWMQDSVIPADHYVERPGRWVAESTWPPQPGRITEQPLFFDGARLGSTPGFGQVECATPQVHGLLAGEWWGSGDPGTLPADQRVEDGRSLTFTSDIVSETMEICGFPEVDLRVSCDTPVALIALRLCDVAPDGSSLLVSRGQLNLTHRDSDEHPESVIPGEVFDVTIRLDAAAHSLQAGHSWRLAVATTNWPLAWPSPMPATVVIEMGKQSRLRLPTRHPRVEDELLQSFDPAEFAPSRRQTVQAPTSERTITVDESGATVLRHTSNDGRHIVDRRGTVYETEVTDVYSIIDEDPLSARVSCIRKAEIVWGEDSTTVAAEATMWADEGFWYVESALAAWHGDNMIFNKTWNLSAKRNYV